LFGFCVVFGLVLLVAAKQPSDFLCLHQSRAIDWEDHLHDVSSGTLKAISSTQTQLVLHAIIILCWLI